MIKDVMRVLLCTIWLIFCGAITATYGDWLNHAFVTPDSSFLQNLAGIAASVPLLVLFAFDAISTVALWEITKRKR